MEPSLVKWNSESSSNFIVVKKSQKSYFFHQYQSQIIFIQWLTCQCHEKVILSLQGLVNYELMDEDEMMMEERLEKAEKLITEHPEVK